MSSQKGLLLRPLAQACQALVRETKKVDAYRRGDLILTGRAAGAWGCAGPRMLHGLWSVLCKFCYTLIRKHVGM